MSNGERKKWEADLGALQVAVTKCPTGTASQTLYAAMAMVLGAVLGDNEYQRNFEDVLREIRKFGVNPVTSFGGGK